MRVALLGSIFGAEGFGQRAAVPDRLGAENYQVGRAGQFEHREQQDGSLDERADAERHRYYLRERAHGVAGYGGYPRDAAERDRAADREQHARPGNGDQHERGDREREQMGGGQHRASVCGDPPAGPSSFAAPGHPAASVTGVTEPGEAGGCLRDRVAYG
jgi:hypothetical protein